MAYVVVYDACVLYPAPLRDFLLQLALTDLFQAKWSAKIHDEWIRAVLRDRPDLDAKLDRTRALMDEALPDATVTCPESLIPALTLPDANDRHVLAVAICSGAQAIVTFNLKDFPASAIGCFGIEAIDPDTFVEHQFHLAQDRVLDAAKAQRARLTNPPKDAQEFLDTLASCGLVKAASLIKPYSNLI